MPPTSFVHLHCHSEGSFLDGLATSKGYAKQAALLGQPALAETDHANLTQAPVFYKACRAEGIEPILGFEGYFVNSFEAVKGEKDGHRDHITILARGERGYAVLSELNHASFEQHYYKPLLDRALLEQLGDDARHLTVLSGCMGSTLSRRLLEDDEEAAMVELLWWRETFPHYYLEIMEHGVAGQRKIGNGLLELSARYGVPYVITNDPHYVHKDDAVAHDALLAIQVGKDMDDPNRFKFDGSGYWLKSRAEMHRTFHRAGYDTEVFRTGVRNTLKIAKESVTRVRPWEKKIWQIPAFPDTDDPVKLLRRLVIKGLKKKGKWEDPIYRRQATVELKVIRQVGLENFLLVNWDTIAAASDPRRGNMRVGPGRGSICGSVVAWAIGLHKMDPIKYKLLFERFLNPERPKMPDIDTDFQKSKREWVFRYNISKYGADNTMAVAAYNAMQVKAAFNSLSKAFGVSYQDARRLNKEIIEMDDPETGETTFLLPDEITSQYPEMASILQKLAGIKRGISPHPAGLIIAPPEAKLREQVPEMFIPSSKRWVASYDKKVLESMGLMKQDFLGLRCLDTIDECLKLIKWRQGIDIEPDDWVPDEEENDAEIYKMLAAGHTSGVFQMEGAVNQRGCRDVRPKSFEDLVSITSLYRTGPIKAGYPAQFIANRRAGQDRIQYLHPLLKPILQDTWGVILYQEQVMEIGRVLAGFDMVRVDDIKEAIKDKSPDAMDEIRPLFVKGCRIRNRISRETAEAIWAIIEGYAGYGYNRSHAVAYTFLTYQTARLKYLYPIEFYAALLRTVENNKDNAERRDHYMRDAIKFADAEWWPADINASEVGATPDLNEDAIRFGLTDLKGIANKTAQKIIGARPVGGFTSVDEVATAVNNVGKLKVLTDGSALESLGLPGDIAETERLLNWNFSDNMESWRAEYADVVVMPDDVHDGDEVDIVGMIYSETKGTTKNGDPYMTWKLRWDVTQAFDVRMWSSCESLWDLRPGSVVRVRGKWQRRWLNITVANRNAVTVLHPVRD